MIVDTSVIVAILRDEPERARFLRLIGESDTPLVSAGNWIELSAVLSNRSDDLIRSYLDPLVRVLKLTIVPVTRQQAEIGHHAYLRFGKGRDPARLNFGDCFAYALSKDTGLPLLFKGEDFSQTDVLQMR